MAHSRDAEGAGTQITAVEIAVAEVRGGRSQEWYRLREVRSLGAPEFQERDAIAAFSIRIAALAGQGDLRVVSVGGACRGVPVLMGRAMAHRIPLPDACALRLASGGSPERSVRHVDLAQELGPVGLRAAAPQGWRAQIVGEPPHGFAALSAFALYVRWQLACGAIGLRSFERSMAEAAALIMPMSLADSELERWLDTWIDPALRPSRSPARRGRRRGTRGMAERYFAQPLLQV